MKSASEILKFLYGESQVRAELENYADGASELITLLTEEEGVETNKTTLVNALKKLDLGLDKIEIDASGFCLTSGDRDAYTTAWTALREPDAMHALAQHGWVAVNCGEQNMANQPDLYKIRFLEVSTAKAAPDQDGDMEAVIKQAREFATEPLEMPDGEPVPAKPAKKAKQPTQGGNPPGTVKDSLDRDLDNLIERKKTPPVDVMPHKKGAGRRIGRASKSGRFQ